MIAWHQMAECWFLVQQLLAAKQMGSLQLLAAVKAVENNLVNEISSWFVYVIAWFAGQFGNELHK